MQQKYAAFYGNRAGSCHIKQAKQEDLLRVDIWQLGMILFCLVDPGLNLHLISSLTEWQIYPNFQRSVLQTI